MERHYFAGGNTMDGFTDLYSSVIDRKACKRLYIIKGGSGVGKSTLIKRVAKELKGHVSCIEFFHCSADINSLDGVAFPELNIALVDGTAPHVVEPVFVKASDVNVDLSKYIDGRKLEGKKAELVSIIENKKLCYSRAYTLVKSMGYLYKDAYEAISDDLNVNGIVDELSDKVLTHGKGKVRRLFAGAYTAFGEVYLDENLDKIKVVRLNGNKCISARILSLLFTKLKDGNHDLAVFCSPISTDYIYGLEVDGKVLFTVNDRIVSKEMQEYDVDEKFTLSVDVKSYTDTLNTHIASLLSTVSDCLTKAKSYHDKLESVYKPCVDFKKIDKETDKLISEIKSLI